MEALESAIASRASRALSLPSTNMALGRKLVAAGLSTSSQTAFDDALQQYGQVDRATRTELFERIRQHARDAAMTLNGARPYREYPEAWVHPSPAKPHAVLTRLEAGESVFEALPLTNSN